MGILGASAGEECSQEERKKQFRAEKSYRMWKNASQTELPLVSWARSSGAKAELLLVLP